MHQPITLHNHNPKVLSKRQIQHVSTREYRKGDGDSLRQFLKNISPISKKFRYFGFPDINISRTVPINTDSIDSRDIVLVAVYGKENKQHIIGEARLIRDPDGTRAEFSIVISDRWQGMGLGKKMTGQILHIAYKQGLRTIYAYALPENTAMLRIFKNLGFTHVDQQDYIYFKYDFKD